MHRRSLFLYIAILLLPVLAFAQRQTPEQYASQYKNMAIREMQRTGIPASITLAQGILESASGNSRLAKKGNNHFGIKCHNWTGRRIFEDDDLRNECFRKYRTADESFIDHSDFLTGKKRYAPLFSLHPKDYRSWAKGLKKAGYATAPDYAHRLISLIERYSLHQYDEISTQKMVEYAEVSPSAKLKNNVSIEKRIRYRNGVPYFIVMEGDTYRSIEQELGLKRKRIAKYNDFEKYKPLVLGEPIYLKKKKKSTPRKYPIHIADGKETLHDIAQRYAIRFKILEERNGMQDVRIPYEGQYILLR
ncbi:flagellum-specific peptidoglycan hydrolase FlgJ [Balneicella halophila]|uniref:Flagellum-specific peptidoglycan hydrolase FlgJ n=1 Tax=Balneicella halophila TaxID=1537566 RepID=A0A7L4UQZ7_BALHA|nr:glucosaminidase domain-containing protein [Balneicella halophila]PVX52173.1 flagellum-specific peptidoglycan hydrolase FlgJ [Balneicella halophila]